MGAKISVERALVLAAYASYLLAASYMKHVLERPETLIAIAALVALVAVVGDKYPGASIVLLTAFVASHLGREYVLGDVEYSLPYARVAICTLLALLAIPAYLATTRVKRPGEAIAGGFHVVVYAIAVSWVRSLGISASTFVGLSAVTTSPALLAVAVSTYAVLTLTTVYVATFSTTDPGRIGALPVEFLGVPREQLGAWAPLSLAKIVALFSLGFLAGRFIERRVAKSRARKSAVAFLLSELLSRAGLAAVASSAAAVALGSSLEGVAAAVAFSTPVVGILGLTESYLSLLDSLRYLMLECQERSESAERAVALSREALKHLRRRGFTPLEGLEGALGAAEKALAEFRSAAPLGMLGYSRIARACLELRMASVELGQKLIDLVTELIQFIRSSLRVGTPETRGALTALLAELEATLREPEKLPGLQVLLQEVASALERYCEYLLRALAVDIPSSYRKVLGFEVSIRELPACAEWSVEGIRALQDHVEALLIGVEKQLESLSARLISLESVARDLKRVLEVYGVEREYLAEFLEYLQGELSQARFEVTSEPLRGLALLLGTRRVLVQRAASALERVLKLKESPVGLLVPDQLKPLEDALRTLSDPELPLAEVMSALESALTSLLSALTTSSVVGELLGWTSMLRLVEPIVLDYVRDAVKRGYKFEEVFPLRDDLRRLWILLYGHGGEDAV